MSNRRYLLFAPILAVALGSALLSCAGDEGIAAAQSPVEPEEAGPIVPVQNGPNLTPPQLQGLLGPMAPRAMVVAGWPIQFERVLDAAIDRMVSEVAAGSYTYVTDSPDGDNPHYGPLKMVTMRNIRAGLPLDETEPGFAAALKITREFVRLYGKPNGYDLVSHRNTNWGDCEIVYWVYRNTPGDNGTLANECRDYLWVAAAWLSYHMGPQYGGPVKLNGTGDERVLALVIETALTADRMGLPYESPSSINPQSIVYKPAGVTSWAQFVVWVSDKVIKPLQELTCETFCGQNDPRGVPIVYGNIRMRANASANANKIGSPPYPILFFEDGMLANALLRAGRQVGCMSCTDHAIEMVEGVRQQYDASQRMLPYVSHDAASGARFKGNGQEIVLNNFWVRPLLEMYALNGDPWMRQTAIELLARSVTDPGQWTLRFKQSQQLGSATEPQAAQALLAGVGS